MTDQILDSLAVKLKFLTDDKGLDEFERRTEAIKAKMESVSRGALAVGGTLTAAAGLAVRAAAGQERFISRLQGNIGLTEEQAIRLANAVERAAERYGVATAELEDAGFTAVSLLGYGTEAFQVIETAARGAASGFGNAATGARFSAAAINTWGKENLNAAATVDVLAKAVELGDFGDDPSGLSRALSQVGSTAAAINIPLGDVAGQLAALSRQGKPVSEAATGVRQLMTWLTRKPSEETVQLLDELGGFSVEGLLGRIRGGESAFDVLKDVADAMGDNLALSSRLFPETEAAGTFQALYGASREVNAQIVADTRDSAGAASGAWRAFADDFLTLWGQMRAVMLNVVRDLGNRLLPQAKVLLWFTSRMVGRWRELPDPVKNVVARVMSLGPLILAAGVALQGLAWSLRPVLAGFGFLRKMALGIGRALKWSAATSAAAWADARRLGVKDFTRLRVAGVRSWLAVRLASIKAAVLSGKAWVIATGGILLVFAALAAAVLLLWKPLRAWFGRFWDGFKRRMDELRPAWERLKIAARPFQEVLEGLLGFKFSAWGDAAADAGEKVAEAFVRAIDRLTELTIRARGFGRVVEGLARIATGDLFGGGALLSQGWEDLRRDVTDELAAVRQQEATITLGRLETEQAALEAVPVEERTPDQVERLETVQRRVVEARERVEAGPAGFVLEAQQQQEAPSLFSQYKRMVLAATAPRFRAEPKIPEVLATPATLAQATAAPQVGPLPSTIVEGDRTTTTNVEVNIPANAFALKSDDPEKAAQQFVSVVRLELEKQFRAAVNDVDSDHAA